MDYKKTYDSIISKAKSENREKGNGIYFESHHIIPICIGGKKYGKENRVLLTAREHYVCHKLLFWMNSSHIGLALAYHSMVYTKKDTRKLKLTSREYEEARRLAHITSLGENNGMYNKKHKEEVKNIISHKAKERFKNPENHPMFGISENHWSYGKKQRIETIEKRLKTIDNKSQEEKDAISQKISKSKKGDKNWSFGKTGEKSPNYGKKQSFDHIAKKRATDIAKPQEEKDAIVAKREATRKRNREAKEEIIRQERAIMIF